MKQVLRKVAVATLLLLLAALIVPQLSMPARCEGQNLLQNGDIEDNDGETASGWESDCWNAEEGFSLFSIDPAGGVDQGAALVVENSELNDARFSQTVAVEKNATYKLSGFIKVEGADGDWGATLSFMDTFVHTDKLLDTEGQWRHVEIYAKTAADQDEITVYARLGGYGSTCLGKAWFDDITLEKVDTVPEGVTATSLATNAPAKSSSDTTFSNELLSLIMIVSIAFVGCLLFGFKRVRGQRTLGERRMDWPSIICFGLLALAVRIALALGITGYPNDIGCWLGWSSDAANNGLFSMYARTAASGGFLDYPPGYLYVLWIVGQINRLVTNEAVQVMVVKLPSILTDLTTAFIVYRMALKRINPREAAILALLFAFNPLVLLDSSAWGQIDSILALIVVGCFWQVYEGKMWQAAVLYAVGLLVKPQMLLFAPVMLGALINASRKEDNAGRVALLWLKTIGAGLGTLIVLVLPFWVSTGDPAWLPNLYLNSLGTYKYASINACNLLALFGGNWVEDTTKILYLPYSVWGYIGMALVSLFTLYVMVFREKDNRRVLLWAALLIAGLFVMGLRMHERYMYPAVALLLVYYIVERDRRALYLFGAFSVTQFLNAAMVLADKHMPTDVIRSGDLIAIADPTGQAIWVLLISLGAIVAFGYMVYASLKAQEPLQLEDDPEVFEKDSVRKLDRIRDSLSVDSSASRLNLSKKDWLLMGGLTLVYAVVALVYLGATKIPQTIWLGNHTGEYAVIDLGQPQSVKSVWHYDGLTKGNFMVSSSEDGKEWTDQVELWHKARPNTDEHDDLGVFKWTTDDVDFTARYVKLSVTVPTVRLQEIVFKDAQGKNIAPKAISDTDSENGEANNLIDEQALTPERPSFYNGTYFDEIYHARTGWEFTQGLDPYENTHPPLGKDLIALGILIFGMDPFGWRIMGTLMGIIMVPVMYLLGMAVFRKTRYAFIAAFLMTFDFMHFVQTRISTIDSYGVLFIMLMFLCMLLYVRKNFNTQPLKSTLLPLALSGIFFGLGAASKWIGLYAGAGLAVIFFYTLYRRWREYHAVRTGELECDEETRELITRGFWKKIIITLLWCALFFIIIPGVIYFASYIPFDNGKGNMWDFGIALKNQTDMFDYHSKLVDDHFFKSPWYQWPFMIKPMWFYQAPNMPDGTIGAITTFGNPAVWWAGTLAMVWLGMRIFRSKRFSTVDYFILAGFLTQFLPWVLVPRSTFIYHYFASVPFFILAIVLYIREWELTSPEKAKRTFIYLGVVLGLFIAFYPVLSGMPIPLWYERLLKWLPTWYFTNQ